jgi:hypothetical protein
MAEATHPRGRRPWPTVENARPARRYVVEAASEP